VSRQTRTRSFFLHQFDNLGSVKVGCEIGFTRYFFRPQPLRAPEEIWGDVRALEQEAEGLLGEIRGVGLLVSDLNLL